MKGGRRGIGGQGDGERHVDGDSSSQSVRDERSGASIIARVPRRREGRNGDTSSIRCTTGRSTR